MANVSTCVINEVVLENPDPFVNRYIYDFASTSFLFSWEFIEERDIELQNPNDTFKKLAKDTLMVIYPKSDSHYFNNPTSIPSNDVRPIKGIIRKSLMFKGNYTPQGDVVTMLYHLVLPDYHLVNKGSIENDEGTSYYLVTRKKRQSITWVASGSKSHKFKAKFSDKGEKGYNEERKKVERIITNPKKVKEALAIANTSVGIVGGIISVWQPLAG